MPASLYGLSNDHADTQFEHSEHDKLEVGIHDGRHVEPVHEQGLVKSPHSNEMHKLNNERHWREMNLASSKESLLPWATASTVGGFASLRKSCPKSPPACGSSADGE